MRTGEWVVAALAGLAIFAFIWYGDWETLLVAALLGSVLVPLAAVVAVLPGRYTLGWGLHATPSSRLARFRRHVHDVWWMLGVPILLGWAANRLWIYRNDTRAIDWRALQDVVRQYQRSRFIDEEALLTLANSVTDLQISFTLLGFIAYGLGAAWYIGHRTAYPWSAIRPEPGQHCPVCVGPAGATPPAISKPSNPAFSTPSRAWAPWVVLGTAVLAAGLLVYRSTLPTPTPRAKGISSLELCELRLGWLQEPLVNFNPRPGQLVLRSTEGRAFGVDPEDIAETRGSCTVAAESLAYLNDPRATELAGEVRRLAQMEAEAVMLRVEHRRKAAAERRPVNDTLRHRR